jgi:hypothetical protein
VPPTRAAEIIAAIEQGAIVPTETFRLVTDTPDTHGTCPCCM